MPPDLAMNALRRHDVVGASAELHPLARWFRFHWNHLEIGGAGDGHRASISNHGGKVGRDPSPATAHAAAAGQPFRRSRAAPSARRAITLAIAVRYASSAWMSPWTEMPFVIDATAESMSADPRLVPRKASSTAVAR